MTQVATGVKAVYTKENTSFIIKQDGSVLGTGYNGNGELGLGNTNEYTTFTALPVSDVRSLDAGIRSSFLIKNDGSLWATGQNYYGNLGTGDKIDKTSFTATSLTSDVVSVSSDGTHTLALKSDGSVWGAGSIPVREGDEWIDIEYGVHFVNLFSGAKAIAMGEWGHSLILANDGTVYSRGNNKYGQLGLGDVEFTDGEFTPVMDNSGSVLSNVIAISAGVSHSLALKSDGTLWATGGNLYGRLGTGDETNRNRFTQVASGIKAMSAGEFHSAVVKNDETVSFYGSVSPWSKLNGSGTILIKVNDTGYYQYITLVDLMDDRLTTIFAYSENITTGDSGLKISVKPGKYDLLLRVSNSLVRTDFTNLTVADNETVTITYEYKSGGYQWTTTRSR
jgi:alpha-tubulin suppressor-like RCC1 family protein